MEKTYLYSEEDINKAYDMGLRSAIYILEETVGFPIESQLELIEKLKATVSITPLNKNPTLIYLVK